MSKSLMPNLLIDDPPQSTKCTRTVHLSLQGKGGVGKSLIASFIAQFYKDHGVRAICVDTDPVNQTFSQYAALGAQHLQLMDGNQIDRRRFDALVEDILANDESLSSITARPHSYRCGITWSKMPSPRCCGRPIGDSSSTR